MLSIYANDYLFLSGNEILAASIQGVQKSTNNGTSWLPLINGMGSIQVNCIKKTSAGILITGTNSSGIYISGNNGESWTQANSGLTNLSILELGIDVNDRIYASTQGGIFVSTDNAGSWQQLNLGIEPTWFYDFDIINGNGLFSSTEKYGILHSTNNGLNWNTSHEGIPVLSARNIVANNASEIFLNANGSIYYSSNSGESWEIRDNGLIETNVISMEIDSDGNLYAGTIDSGLFRSSDKGISWSNIIIPDVDRVDIIEFDQSDRITINSGNKLYHSSDSGTNWTQVFNSDTAFFLSRFLTVNDNGSIFIGGFTFFVEEVIFYSNDFGVSWDSVNFGNTIKLTALYSAGNNVYAAFDDFSIKYSDDDGETWQIFPTISFGSPVVAMKKLNNGIFLAGTQTNGVFYTSDNGNNWNFLSVGLPSGSSDFPNFIAADINSILYIGYYSQGVYKNDTWQNVVPVEITSFTASSNGNNVILEWVTSTETNNSGFEILRSAQNNNVWRKIGFVNGNGTTTNQSDYSFIDSEVKTGKFFYRLKQIDFDGSFKYSDVVEIEVDVPDKFALYQNHPNPFNPTTKIKFVIGSQQLVIIKVYDMLGNEITTLVNDIKEPGIYESEFNASQLSSGTYFYQLKAGNYVETKKLLLIK